MKQVQSSMEEGVNNVIIDLSDLQNGVYSLQIFENDVLGNVTKVVKN